MMTAPQVSGLARVMRAAVLSAALAASAVSAWADSRQLAPGFSKLPRNATVLVAPLDIELFSISAGGVLEPKADWTAAAQGHVKTALLGKVADLGLKTTEIDTNTADNNAELLNLHAAVAQSIALHHFGGMVLPAKDGKLEWSFGDVFKPLAQKTGARYGLFTWVRDSYASSERVATMVVMSMLGVGLGGGMQVGYASLVDLETGQVLWFNRLLRASGDLREAKPAVESVGALLGEFPVTQ
jgi:hypothetical protein